MGLVFWFLYLLCFPFQLLPPGSPQIADLFLMAGIGLSIRKTLVVDNFIKASFAFCAYALVLGAVFGLLYREISFVLIPANYVYCAATLLFVRLICNQPGFAKVTLAAIFISLLIQIRVFQIVGINEEQFRFTLMFNNPNQLGFWGLNLLVIIFFLLLYFPAGTMMRLVMLASVGLCFFYIILSISQAAIISSVLITLLVIWRNRTRKGLYVLLAAIVLLLGLNADKLRISDLQMLENVQARVAKESTNEDGDNGVEGRNYVRLWRFPQYLVFGSGEGVNQRFGTDLNEIHSTYANILFSYGLVGLALMALPIINFIRNKNLTLVAILLFYFVFTLVHNTLRWPLFWIVPYLLYNLDFSNKEIKPATQEMLCAE